MIGLVYVAFWFQRCYFATELRDQGVASEVPVK